MGMTRKVAISVPDDLLAAVDAESRAARTSRSRVFGLAARSYLDRRRRQRDVDLYLASYRELPEGDDEVAAGDAFLRRAFNDEG